MSVRLHYGRHAGLALDSRDFHSIHDGVCLARVVMGHGIAAAGYPGVRFRQRGRLAPGGAVASAFLLSGSVRGSKAVGATDNGSEIDEVAAWARRNPHPVSGYAVA